MNRNVNRSYDEEICYQFINPVHSFLMESVHGSTIFSIPASPKMQNCIFPVWIPARGTKTRRAQDKINRIPKGV